MAGRWFSCRGAELDVVLEGGNLGFRSGVRVMEHGCLFEGVLVSFTTFVMWYTKLIFQISQNPHLTHNIPVSGEVGVGHELYNVART